MRIKSISELCDDRYSRPEVAQAVMENAAEHGTTSRIESGELALPTEVDANNWFDRLFPPVAEEAPVKRRKR